MTLEPSSHSAAPIRSVLLAPLRGIYILYAAVAFIVLSLSALLVIAFLPGVGRRRAVTRAAARTFLRVAGMPLTVKFAERLPKGQCVIVANHCSYLDGPVFTAALPARFSFVIKREMATVPIAGLLLRRLGSEFVERFHRSRVASDARRVLKTALGGQSLVFFPEGTFTPTPGLLKFHIGAFVTAARAHCPVVPAVIRGTRVTFSPRTSLPHPGRIEIEILPPILPPADPDTEAQPTELRDRARAAILRASGEPDLTCSDDTDHPLDTEHEISARANRL